MEFWDMDDRREQNRQRNLQGSWHYFTVHIFTHCNLYVRMYIGVHIMHDEFSMGLHIFLTIEWIDPSSDP